MQLVWPSSGRYFTGDNLTKTEWQAIQWCRTSHTGRRLADYLEAKIVATREVYEAQPAAESQRLLLAAYKDLYRVLFETDITEL